VGLSRFELLTPRLSSVCSNQLSYRPVLVFHLRPTRFSKHRLVKEPRASPLVPSKLDRALHNQLVEYQIDLSIIRPCLTSDDARLRRDALERR
jgi:hypothetical protein